MQNSSDFDQQIHGAIRAGIAMERMSGSEKNPLMIGIKNRIRQMNGTITSIEAIVAEPVKPEEREYASIATHNVGRLSINTSAPRSSVVSPVELAPVKEHQYTSEQPTSSEPQTDYTYPQPSTPVNIEASANPVMPPQETTLSTNVVEQGSVSPQSHAEYIDALSQSTLETGTQAAVNPQPGSFEDIANEEHNKQWAKLVNARIAAEMFAKSITQTQQPTAKALPPQSASGEVGDGLMTLGRH